jgi:hypothetical protein
MILDQQDKQTRKQGWIRMIGITQAEGQLKALYEAMKSHPGSRPSVYDSPSGDAANIVKAHSLDPEGLRLTFSCSSAIHWSPYSLPWEKREMINTVTSGANNCYY